MFLEAPENLSIPGANRRGHEKARLRSLLRYKMAVSFVLVSERGVFLDFRHVWDLLLSIVVQNGEYPPDLFQVL